MPNGIEVKAGTERRGKIRERRSHEMHRRRWIARSRPRHPLAATGNGSAAAIVCLRGWGALTLHAALGCRGGISSERKTVERSDQQEHGNHAHHDLNPSPHSH
jgi:hypothetical protein